MATSLHHHPRAHVAKAAINSEQSRGRTDEGQGPQRRCDTTPAVRSLEEVGSTQVSKEETVHRVRSYRRISSWGGVIKEGFLE